MTNKKLRLSIGTTGGQRIVGAAFGIVFAAVGTAFVLLPLLADGMLRRLTGSEPEATFSDGSPVPREYLPPELRHSSAGGSWWDSDGFGLGPARFIGLCGIPFALIGVYMVLRILRHGAWLDGTTAHVRGALLTRSVDLASADVTAGTVAYRSNRDTLHETVHRIPTIIARDPGTGRTVTVPLQSTGLAALPPYELRALADAMTAGRSTDGRGADVYTIARQLRQMAENPLGL